MRVVILGIGDAFTRRYFGSAALIEDDGDYLLLDCPDLIHRALYEASFKAGWSVDASRIHHVLLTHLHGDHCNGLESFALHRMLKRMEGERLPLPTLHTSEPVAMRLWERLAPALDEVCCFESPPRLEDFFSIATLDPGRTAHIAGLSVRCRFTKHPVPTTGFLISDGSWTLGWSGDTAFDEDHIRWLAQADVVVHETNHGPVHTPVEALNRLPDAVRQKLHLIHIPDDFDAATTDIRVLRQGEVLTAEQPPRTGRADFAQHVQ